jgi:hypothetical protein
MVQNEAARPHYKIRVRIYHYVYDEKVPVRTG